MATAQTPLNVNELFQQTMETFQTAVRTGVKLQEESTHRLTELLQGMGSPLDWQKNAQQMMNQSIEATQKNIEDSIQIINQNTQAAMTMMQKAFQSESHNGAPQAKAEDLWETALGTLRSNTQTVLEANARLLDSWAKLVKDSMAKVQNGVAHKAEG